MQYSEIRDLIETGDLISVRSGESLLNRATKFFTGPYIHCGLAIWLAGRLYMTELNGGRNHLIPLSQLEALDFDVYARPDGLTIEACEASILENLGRKVDYGYAALVAIGVIEWLKLTLVVKWSKILVCSGYCIKNWQDAGWKGAASRVVSPTKLAGMVRLKFAVTLPTASRIIPAYSAS
jgi:hypothetical protein